jgi:hypothetical protein
MAAQPAVIVDVDDTLCDVSKLRHLYDVPAVGYSMPPSSYFDSRRAFTVNI